MPACRHLHSASKKMPASGERLCCPRRLRWRPSMISAGPVYRLSIRQGVSMGRPSEIEAEARKSDGVVTSVSVGGATAYVASGEIEVPPSALV